MATLAGSFLVARSILQDPNFRQTVVLILQHREEGAFGLVVNRPTQLKQFPFPVFSGGPCEANGLLMLHGHEDWVDSGPGQPCVPVAPGIFLGDSSCVSKVSNPAPDQELNFRMFSGYAGWGPDQLESELAAGAWLVVQATGEMLFDIPVEDLWDRLAPPSIPQPSLN